MLVLILNFLVPLVIGAHLPSNVEVCHRSDPSFVECFQKTMSDGLKKFKEGNKELGVPVIDPFFVPKIELGGSPGASVTLDQKYENVHVHGMSNTAFKDFEYNLEKGNCHWAMTGVTPVIRMEADYVLKGQILVFPINGQGRCNVTMINNPIRHTIKCEIVQKKGKDHIKVTDYTLDMHPEKVIFDFHNMLEGNEKIATELSKTINENSLAIFNDVRSGFEQVFATLHKQFSNNVFAKVPLQEIFLD